MNKWGLTSLGASLILGLFVRFQFPLVLGLWLFTFSSRLAYPNPNFTLWDQHIIYIAVLLFFAAISAGQGFRPDKVASTITPDLKSGWDKIMITFNDFQK